MNNQFIQEPIIINLQSIPNNTVYELTVFKFDRLYLKAIGADSYQWIPIPLTPYLAIDCYPYSLSSELKFVPQREFSYKLIGTTSTDTYTIMIKIILTEKPNTVLDTDLIPVYLYDAVLQKNQKRIIQLLRKNNKLLNYLTEFYNVTLQNSIKYIFQAKQGRGYRVPWITKYQIYYEQKDLILSYQQQYSFMQYLQLNNHKSNIALNGSYFLYLMNVIQYNFVLPSCQNPKNYYKP